MLLFVSYVVICLLYGYFRAELVGWRSQHHSGRSADTHECLRSHAPRTQLRRLLYNYISERTCGKNERALFGGVLNLPNGGNTNNGM
jgi:hypothetical protein